MFIGKGGRGIMTRLGYGTRRKTTAYNYGYHLGITSDLKGFLIYRR